MIDLAKLKRLEAEATKGPWNYDTNEDVHPTNAIHSIDNGDCLVVDYVEKDSDRSLIAESRNAMPELLKWIEEAQSLLRAGTTDGEGWSATEEERVLVLLSALKEPENGK